MPSGEVECDIENGPGKLCSVWSFEVSEKDTQDTISKPILSKPRKYGTNNVYTMNGHVVTSIHALPVTSVTYSGVCTMPDLFLGIIPGSTHAAPTKLYIQGRNKPRG